MQKKPGQISSNTLGLRFMQNAAKAKQEQEIAAARAKVKSEEEWEVSPEVKESWGIGNHAVEEQKNITYEQSYLPFLFPGISSASATSSATGTSKRAEPEGFSQEENEGHGPSLISFRGRRTFGKHGEEEIENSSAEPSTSSPINVATPLPRGARSISSHGPSAVSRSKAPSPTKHQLAHHRESPPLQPQKIISRPATGFVKPQVDAPREDSRVQIKRPLNTEKAVDGTREFKKRKKKATSELAQMTPKLKPAPDIA